jgi:hypothetical protein
MQMKTFAVTIALTVCTAPAFAIGPSFCGAPTLPPGARLVCSSPELSRIDLAYGQAYYVMRQIVGQPGWQDLKVATINYENDTLRVCGVPMSGPLPPNTQALVACVGRADEAQRTAWLGRLTGAALEEARRPVEQHLALQQRLQATGFLPADSQHTPAGPCIVDATRLAQRLRTPLTSGLTGVARANIATTGTDSRMPITNLPKR